MIEQTGETYASSKFAKALFASDPKIGKSCFLVASALGVLPWQKRGGIVDKPENLHVITFDANALGGIQRFLLETCGAPKECLGFRIYNLQEDMRRVSVSQTDYDRDFFNAVMTAINTVGQRAKGTPVLHFSSLTGVAQGLERAVAGPAGKHKGYGMDQSKWGDFAHQLNEIRNYGQLEKWHCFWEAHIYKPQGNSQDKDAPPPKETLQVSGKTGQNFAYNVEQVFRLRRQMGQTHPGTKCDLTYLDTRPAMDFLAGGRSFTEALAPKEYDLTEAFMKLGLQTGHWGQK